VTIGRCADSVLARWEGALRIGVAWDNRIKSERRTLLDTESLVIDPLPESWMRTWIMAHGADGTVRWFEQLRIRLRIARTLAFLAPAFATSTMLALALAHDGEAGPDHRAFWTMFHVVTLLIVFAAAEFAPSWSPPRTQAREHWKPDENNDVDSRAMRTWERKRFSWWASSPASIWFAAQAAAAIAVLISVSDSPAVWVRAARRRSTLGDRIRRLAPDYADVHRLHVDVLPPAAPGRVASSVHRSTRIGF